MKKEFSDVEYEMFIMPWGKHQGKTFNQLPAHYLLWLVDEDFCPEIVKAYVELHEEELIEAAEDYFSDYGY